MITEQEIQQLTEIAKKFEAANADAVTTIIQTHCHPVFQRINDGGRTAANATNKEKLDAADKRVKELEGQLEAKSTELKTLTEKTPDVATLRREYETKIAGLETQHKAALAERDGLITKGHMDRAIHDLVGYLESDEFKIDPEYARTVLANQDAVRSRIRLDAEGKVSVLQEGQKELTITPSTDRSVLHHLAEEIAKKVPDKWKTSGVQNRGPRMNGSQKTGDQGKNRFDEIREAEEARNKDQRKTVPRPGLARMGGQPITAE